MGGGMLRRAELSHENDGGSRGREENKRQDKIGESSNTEPPSDYIIYDEPKRPRQGT